MKHGAWSTGGRVFGGAALSCVGLLLALVAFAQVPKGQGTAGQKKSAGRMQLAPGVWVDWERGMLEAAGSCAADLFAASADVARIKAERLARLRAEERLRKALASLSHDDKQRQKLVPYGGAEQVGQLDPARAQVAALSHAASGSVSLRLELALSGAAAADLGAGGLVDMSSGPELGVIRY